MAIECNITGNASQTIKEIDQGLKNLQQIYMNVDKQANSFNESMESLGTIFTKAISDQAIPAFSALENLIKKIISEEKEMKESQEQAAQELGEIDEAIEKRIAATQRLADIDEEMRIQNMNGEEQKQAQLDANHNKRMADMKALHEMQLSLIEEGSEEELEIKEEQINRIIEMELQHGREKEAIKKKAHDEELLRMAEISSVARESMQFTKDTLESLKDENAAYMLSYKAAAISEASMNAVQSILRTMAGTPYPFNIALAAAQGAAAFAKVNEIRRMYRGGMIPGANTLIMANEQGREAILNTRAVRAVGGEAGVNALNRGTSNTYDNSRSSTININMNTAILTQKAFRDEIEPILKRAERRR